MQGLFELFFSSFLSYLHNCSSCILIICPFLLFDHLVLAQGHLRVCEFRQSLCPPTVSAGGPQAKGSSKTLSGFQMALLYPQPPQIFTI